MQGRYDYWRTWCLTPHVMEETSVAAWRNVWWCTAGMTVREGLLVLADGSVFEGELIGAAPPGGVATGEVVFNTALSGYQEIITDPSYAGQIITFTYPHIGNYGVTAADNESRCAFCRGVVVRDLARRHSNFRAEDHLGALLAAHTHPGHRRHRHPPADAPHPRRRRDARRVRRRRRRRAGCALPRSSPAPTASTSSPRSRPPRRTPSATVRASIVAYDFGIKTTILRQLPRLGRVEVVPATTSAADVLARRPDGVFLSNGPGDPAMVQYATDEIAKLIGNVPVFGICLGHQLARARARRQARSSCRSATTAATTRCATCDRGRSRSPARTTTSPSTPSSPRWASRCG